MPAHSPVGDGTSPRGWRQGVSPVFLRAVSSVTLGGITYGLTTLTGQSARDGVVLSVFIAGVVLVVQYLATFERRIADFGRQQTDNLTALNRRHQTDLARLTTSTRLLEAVRRSPLDAEELHRFVTNLAQIRAAGLDLVSELTMAEVRRALDVVDQLRAGETWYAGEDRDWLLLLTHAARAEIMATSSMLVDSGFWESELGDRYLAQQAGAVRRGVIVRRIFRMDDPALLDDPRFVKLCARHTDVGIDYRVIDARKLSLAQYNEYQDVVLFDRLLHYQVRSPPGIHLRDNRGAVVETRLSLKPSIVGPAVDYFEQLWQLAGRGN